MAGVRRVFAQRTGCGGHRRLLSVRVLAHVDRVPHAQQWCSRWSRLPPSGARRAASGDYLALRRSNSTTCSRRRRLTAIRVPSRSSTAHSPGASVRYSRTMYVWNASSTAGTTHAAGMISHNRCSRERGEDRTVSAGTRTLCPARSASGRCGAAGGWARTSVKAGPPAASQPSGDRSPLVRSDRHRSMVRTRARARMSSDATITRDSSRRSPRSPD